MADSFSPLLNLRLQQTGGNSNTWGDLLNTDALIPLETAIAGRGPYTITGGTLDLSAAPIVPQLLIFGGTLTADQTVILPNLPKRMILNNATTGNFFLTFKCPTAGFVACVPQNTAKDVFIDGANNVIRMDREEVGKIQYFARPAAPSGYFVCDGSAKSRAGAVDLFNAIGTTWGTGNGATTFNIPDLTTNNRYLRSSGGGLSVGQTQTDDVKPHNHTASGSTSTSVSLSIAGDGAWTPSISISDPGHGHTLNSGGGHAYGTFNGVNADLSVNSGGVTLSFVGNTATASTGIGASSSGIGNHTHPGSSAGASSSTSVTVNNSTGTETRPHSAVALACIRY
jgi:hypothetical protein